MTQVWEYIKIALMNIRSNKGRSILTMLGIIIGISSVIMIISIGNGVKSGINGELNSMAGGQIAVYSNNTAENGTEVIFTEEDMDAIQEKVPNVKAVSYDRPRTESPTLNAGILTAFRLSKRVDLNVEIQGSLLNEQFNRVEMNHLTDGIVQLSAGLTFKLGKTDFEVLEPMDYALLNDLNGQINSLRAANDELSKRPVSCPECQETVTEVVNNYVDNVVYFRINSAKIDKNQQINIYNTAEFMKNNNAPIKVVGYADKKTGTSDYNMGLSEKRARAVAKELIDKYGISSSPITIEWRGSDEQPYGENSWNRVVIMSANN